MIQNDWRLIGTDSMPRYEACAIASLPDVAQGFTTRRGGVGAMPYDTLNLSFTCGDDPDIVAANRERLATTIGIPVERFACAEQVHGSEIAILREPPVRGSALPKADGLITDVPGVLLFLQFADCFPVYIVAPEKRVVALLHSGWRGTAANIVQAATDALASAYGVEPGECLAAIGPGIGGDNYEVGGDVACSFATGYEMAVSPVLELRAGAEGKYSLHVRRAIYAQLIACGYSASKIAMCMEDTYSNRRDFFSHRRESRARLRTGRMSAYLGVRSNGHA